MCGRHQHVQQRQHVLHLGCVTQVVFFGLFCGHLQVTQRVAHHTEVDTAARQDHHVLGQQAVLRHGGHQPLRGLAAFEGAQGFFGHFTRGGQAVTPGQRAVVGQQCLPLVHGRILQHRAADLRQA